MNFKILLSSLIISTLIFSGCSKDEDTGQDNNSTDKNYTCESGNCVEDENGNFSSKSDCENSCGGNNNNNTCESTFTDPRDGKTYSVVKIGSQCWFAENLNYETGNSWCYDNDPANCNTYGRLYDWNTARDVCPEGWHLPRVEEWTELTDYLGGESVAGEKMKSTSGWDIANGDNSSGFSALPGGERTVSESFISIGGSAYWWTFGSDGRYRAWLVRTVSSSDVEITLGYKAGGCSCRCIKD